MGNEGYEIDYAKWMLRLMRVDKGLIMQWGLTMRIMYAKVNDED